MASEMPVAADHVYWFIKTKTPIVWLNVVKFSTMHLLALAGLVLLPWAKWQTVTLQACLFGYALLGVTAGCHRLWTHRAYKARFPLRFFLMLANCVAAQNSIYTWCRDHRVHHKFSDTDADPHNSKRGFFFSHIGWLLLRKHPQVIREGSKISMTDLRADKLLMFQYRYCIPLCVLGSFVLPTALPCWLWDESWTIAYTMSFLRYMGALHATFLVNSAAHMWGWKPYDINIAPVENWFVSLFALGEGFHNYHHSFPQDYSTSEWRYSLNFTTMFIDFMAAIGLAYDRKSTPKQSILSRISKTGPGTSSCQSAETKEGLEL